MINGKEYPLWQQFVDKKNKWIGGELVDEGDYMDKKLGFDDIGKTEITDIELAPNGKEGAYFTVHGKDFSCGFSCEVGGVVGSPDKPGWIMFAGYGGHKWRIRGPE